MGVDYWRINAVIAGYGEKTDILSFIPNRFELGAGIRSTSPFFALGFRTVYKMWTPFGSSGVLTPQGIGVYPIQLVFVPAGNPPNFPYGIAVTTGMFPFLDVP